MSDLIVPSKAIFFVSILYNERALNLDLIQLLTAHFGPSVEWSHPFFPMKKYYSKEMGEVADLKRIFFLFFNPLDREKLVEEKCWADQLEKNHLIEGQRSLNIDVGILTPENVQLATGKSFAHRIYLGQGVYSDLNLLFEGKSFRPLPWAYPDYAHPDFIGFFNWARQFVLLKKE